MDPYVNSPHPVVHDDNLVFQHIVWAFVISKIQIQRRLDGMQSWAFHADPSGGGQQLGDLNRIEPLRCRGKQG